MSFRYINPGYGGWFNDASVITVENNYNYNPEQGISFKKAASAPEDENKIILPKAFTTDIYASFYMYVGDNRPRQFYLGAKKAPSSASEPAIASSCIGIYIDSGNVYLLAGASTIATGGTIGNYIKNLIKNDTLHKIQFHIHRGESAATSFGEVTINGSTQIREYSDNNYRNTFGDYNAFYVRFPTTYGEEIYFSNLIVSDEPISEKEKIIKLPISATATDMTAGENGMYTATAAGQTFLQTPDITTLAQQFSGESKITGIQVVGNPAYKNSTGLETMIGLSKSGNVTTEHGSYTLGTDSTALVMDGWGLSGVTLNDLPNMQFGWKVAD